jgi:Uma2 family endonuclease
MSAAEVEAMSTTTRLITADELLAMPHRDEHGNDCRLDLVRGEIIKKPLFSLLHGMLCADLGAIIGAFVEANDLGAVFGTGTGFLVEQNPDSVLGIDVSFVSHERLRGLENLDTFPPFAPDLAIEVLNPSDTTSEVNEKITLYLAAGSRAVWVFNPRRRTVAVYSSPSEFQTLSEQDTLDGGDVLPGFELKLSELFAAVEE